MTMSKVLRAFLGKGEELAQSEIDDVTEYLSDARLHAFLASAVDGVITIDQRGNIESINPAGERLFGYAAAEVIGQNVKLLMPSPYQEQHDSYLQHYLETGERRIIGIGREVEGRRKDGTVFPMYLSVSEVMLGSKRIFTGIVHDLTELKQIERSVARLGRILEDSLNEIYIFNAETLKFECVNRGARHNLGYKMRELQHLTPVDLKPGFTLEKFEQILAPLREGHSNSVVFETAHRRKDKTTYPVEVHVQLSRVAGESVFVAIVLDISERKQAEAERLRLTRELDSRVHELRIRDQALRSAGEGVVIADASNSAKTIVFVNEAFESMTGYTAQEVIGKTCCLLFDDDLDQPGVAAISSALESFTECHAVVRSYRKNGSMFWNDITIAPVQNGELAPSHLVAVMEDVTEHRRNHERLVQSERLAAIGEMVAGLAHESRNALQRAQACLDNLSLDLADQPEKLDLTRRASVAVDDLRRLYEEVRHYSAPINLQLRRCNLTELWTKIWEDLALVRADRSVELALHDAVGFPLCRVDDHRIEQVFRNIFENAIAVCPEPGRVEIKWSETMLAGQPAVEISVSDNGPGMKEEVVDRVFQPFFTTKQKGTGLGLAIAKRIIDAHGGLIEVRNCETAGAEFVVTLLR